MSTLRIAIIGADAAGLYAADLLMRCVEHTIHVDLVDPAPAPIGLGPALRHQPDSHRSRVRVVGNVTIGTDEQPGDLSIDSLRPFYDAVISAPSHSEQQVNAAVAAALWQASTKPARVFSDSVSAFLAHDIAVTVWDNALDLPTNLDFAGWQEKLALARSCGLWV
ncbi:MAG: FAD/NAD(P)-binding protein [Corynebacterium sp.]|uniref:FAD/NAD(P)-binding protein n=1 Tax=Corynebacterium sp. TaxID=1720 RepID=UPI0026DD93AC|nr:FAD/NAD(P)-binding protein [Corynebacterium sp.]MDO4760579.1 FAD/NAD(P)-binding protein [Corynebacterium sp.]